MLATDLDALILRINDGRGHDAELNEIIDCDILGNARNIPPCEHCGTVRVRFYPDYTGEIDAALRVIPESWSRDIRLKRHGGHHWTCELHKPSREWRRRHKELPRAILIAALRAQEDS